MITALHVEEKARAKDASSISAAAENVVSANIVIAKKTYYNKNKGKMWVGGKHKKTTNFKKNTGKNNITCFVCGKEKHLAKDCCHNKTNLDGNQKNVVNVTIGKNNGDEVGPSSKYGNLPFVFFFSHSIFRLMG
jgi:hypothetical protein